MTSLSSVPRGHTLTPLEVSGQLTMPRHDEQPTSLKVIDLWNPGLSTIDLLVLDHTPQYTAKSTVQHSPVKHVEPD